MMSWFRTRSLEAYRRWLKSPAQRIGLHQPLAATASYTRRMASRGKSLYAGIRAALPPHTIRHTFEDITVVFPVRTRWQWERFRSPHNEHVVLADMASEIRPDDVVYDVGAYLGWHTCVASQAASSGRVIAFEPHPFSFARLRTVLAASAPNAMALCYALSDHEGEVFFSHESGPGSRCLVPGEPGIEVDAGRGDILVERYELPPPDVIKIDVEGAELGVLVGLRGTISQPRCRLIYCEIHPELMKEFGSTAGQVLAFLQDHGFDCAKFDDQPLKWTIKATRQGGSSRPSPSALSPKRATNTREDHAR